MKGNANFVNTYSNSKYGNDSNNNIKIVEAQKFATATTIFEQTL